MSHRRLGAALIAACVALPLAVPAAASAGSSSRDIKVMTRNVYVGADLITLATAPDREAFKQGATKLLETLAANDYNTRAKRLAQEIRTHKPDVVGLQEAARWLRGADGVDDGSKTPATTVIYDSVESLQRELRAIGQNYRVVSARDWFDYEGPTAGGFDARIIQRDVMLVRAGSKVRVRSSFRGGFRDTFDPPTAIGIAAQKRGWVGINARVGNRSFRLVNTHLEAYSADINEKQMKQLLAGPLKSKRTQSILIGDINSGPQRNADERGADRTPAGYGAALDADFFNPLPRRETCCFAEDLRKVGPDKLDSWIDHILVRPRIRVIRSSIVGSRSSERVGGLWPSDHAGIVATLRLK